MEDDRLEKAKNIPLLSSDQNFNNKRQILHHSTNYPLYICYNHISSEETHLKNQKHPFKSLLDK